MQIPRTALHGLIHPRLAKSRRESSWDRNGGNIDAINIEPHAMIDIAKIPGQGCVKHIWMTALCDDPLYLRKTILRIYWDGEENPSVEVPLGDFFGVGHAKVSHYISIPLNMITDTWALDINAAAMNCYWPMPFLESAIFQIHNESNYPIKSFYFHIDYERYPNPPLEEILHFHAQWRRINPTPGTLDMTKEDVNLEISNAASNLNGLGNYIILEAEGNGHYVGCNLSIDHIDPIPDFHWFGEGDDMIWIDEDAIRRSWPPTLHGTGTEDYFCAAWGFPTGKYDGPYHGVSLAGPVKGDHPYSGKWTAYRYHIEDPIFFQKCILVSIEHGHANCHSNDYSSTAYWYQTEPHLPFPQLPIVEDRLPISDEESLARYRKILRI
jgi:hypothetical protein